MENEDLKRHVSLVRLGGMAGLGVSLAGLLLLCQGKDSKEHFQKETSHSHSGYHNIITFKI